MNEVKISANLEGRLPYLDNESLQEIVVLIALLKEFGIEVILILDRVYRELIYQEDKSGSIIWIAFRIYMDRGRVNVLAQVEQDGSIVLY